MRPVSEKEIKARDESIVQFPGNGQILVSYKRFLVNLLRIEKFLNKQHPINLQCEGQNDVQKPKLFSYNVVFEPGATQEDILQYSGIKRLIEMAIEGFNATVFCYGQTGKALVRYKSSVLYLNLYVHLS